jgi:hypothetical protein
MQVWTNTVVHRGPNNASIRFGLNPIILTDQVDDNDPSKGVDPSKEGPVTIDHSPPSNFVQPLPAVESMPQFLVSWSGTDVGSGIVSYDIYAAIPPLNLRSVTRARLPMNRELNANLNEFGSQPSSSRLDSARQHRLRGCG